MPRLNRPPKHRKHKASGQAVVTLGGVDHYLGPHGTKASRREYDRLIGEWLVSGGVTAAADSITVAELLVAFLKHAEKHYGKASTETASFKTLARRLRKTYGHTPVSDFGPLRLKAFRETLIEEKLSRGTIAATTAAANGETLPTRTSKQREKAVAAAERELEEMGA